MSFIFQKQTSEQEKSL